MFKNLFRPKRQHGPLRTFRKALSDCANATNDVGLYKALDLLSSFTHVPCSCSISDTYCR